MKKMIVIAFVLMFASIANAKNSTCITPPFGAPPAIGTYCPAILSSDGNLETSLFVPLDATGKLVEGGMEAQSARLMEIVDLYLDAAGMDADDIQ